MSSLDRIANAVRPDRRRVRANLGLEARSPSAPSPQRGRGAPAVRGVHTTLRAGVVLSATAVCVAAACTSTPATTPSSASTASADPNLTVGPASVTGPATGATIATTGSAPAPAPGSAAPSASGSASARAAIDAAALPAGFPGASEWASAARVDVDGAEELGCEARAAGEWLEVTCRGFNYSGAVPTGLEIEAGANNGGAVRVPAGPGAVTLGARFVAGTELTARFQWGVPDQRLFTHALVLSWPAGKAKPATAGKFAGAPKQKPDPKLSDALCKCLKEQFGEAHGCGDLYDPNRWVPECVRTFMTMAHCSVLNSCQEIEMNGRGTCLRDEAHYGFTAMARCGIKCNPKKPECPTGKTCLGARDTKRNEVFVCQ